MYIGCSVYMYKLFLYVYIYITYTLIISVGINMISTRTGILLDDVLTRTMEDVGASPATC